MTKKGFEQLGLKVFIIHGAYGEPNENWFPWLKNELEKLGIKVFVPRFPTPERQNLNNWLEVFKEYIPWIDEKTIFVGHSLGPAFIMNILENLRQPILAAFFVSGFTGLLGQPEFDEINKTITDKEFHYLKIRRNCKKFFIYNSDNDPYVPLQKGNELARKLNGKLIIIKNGGHINASAGYTEFPLLLKDLKDFLRNINITNNEKMSPKGRM